MFIYAARYHQCGKVVQTHCVSFTITIEHHKPVCSIRLHHKDIMPITSRFITPDDYQLLATSLASDEYHKDTPPEFFYEEDTVCSVFEDEDGPVLFVKAKPFRYDSMVAIQLDIQYVKNEDAKRNMKAMLVGFPIIEER